MVPSQHGPPSRRSTAWSRRYTLAAGMLMALISYAVVKNWIRARHVAQSLLSSETSLITTRRPSSLPEPAQLDKRLEAIAPRLAVLDRDVRDSRSRRCWYAASKPAPAHAETASAECRVYEVAEKEMAAIRQDVLTSKSPPRDAYIFYIAYRPDPSETGCEDDCDDIVGLFSSLDDCVRTEAVARRGDLPTRPCRPWYADRTLDPRRGLPDDPERGLPDKPLAVSAE
jgi:hypothetical protein